MTSSGTDENGWLDISSAPKDRSWLHVARGDQQAIAWFNETTRHWAIGGMSYFDNPTHWRPPPKPPVASPLIEGE